MMGNGGCGLEKEEKSGVGKRTNLECRLCSRSTVERGGILLHPPFFFPGRRLSTFRRPFCLSPPFLRGPALQVVWGPGLHWIAEGPGPPTQRQTHWIFAGPCGGTSGQGKTFWQSFYGCQRCCKFRGFLGKQRRSERLRDRAGQQEHFGGGTDVDGENSVELQRSADGRVVFARSKLTMAIRGVSFSKRRLWVGGGKASGQERKNCLGAIIGA